MKRNKNNLKNVAGEFKHIYLHVFHKSNRTNESKPTRTTQLSHPACPPLSVCESGLTKANAHYHNIISVFMEEDYHDLREMRVLHPGRHCANTGPEILVEQGKEERREGGKEGRGVE